MAQLELVPGGRSANERVSASLSLVRAEQCLMLVICYFEVEDIFVAMVLEPAVGV